jgi:hypothetical protein
VTCNGILLCLLFFPLLLLSLFPQTLSAIPNYYFETIAYCYSSCCAHVIEFVDTKQAQAPTVRVVVLQDHPLMPADILNQICGSHVDFLRPIFELLLFGACLRSLHMPCTVAFSCYSPASIIFSTFALISLVFYFCCIRIQFFFSFSLSMSCEFTYSLLASLYHIFSQILFVWLITIMSYHHLDLVVAFLVNFVCPLGYSFFYLGYFVCYLDLLYTFSDNFFLSLTT